MPDSAILLKILDLARWAPSGDNTQPWQFEIVSSNHIAVKGFDTRDHVIYDFDGHASHMAHGALLETLRIAATGFGFEATWSIRQGTPDTAPIYDVLLHNCAKFSIDPLFHFIEKRVVQRRVMRTTPLSPGQRQALGTAVGAAYKVQFFESLAERVRVAGLLWDNAYIRLTCPEAFEVHSEIIEWGSRFSKDRIPEEAVGVDPLTGRLMQWVMQRWSRVAFFNRYLLGTVPPRIQLDFLPALGCAAHLLLSPREPLVEMTDYVRAGVALQRLWLTASSLGLHLQPEMTPVIFRWYARAGKVFSKSPEISRRTLFLAERFERLAGAREESPMVFLCRLGNSVVPRSRSLRKDLSELLVEQSGD
jgi:hypothetical protein